MKKLVCLVLGLSLLISVPAFAQKRGGTVAGPVITTAFVENFNPYTQNINRSPAPGFMYEPLMVYNFRQNKIEYRLATAFEYSDDLMSITYTLREGVKWSDGKPFTADDVVFSFDLAKTSPAVDINSLFHGESPKLKSAEKIDDHTVRFHLTKPDSTVDWYITGNYIVPKHIWLDVDPATFANEKPVGTGPLTEVEKFSPQQITVCRNPHYWEEGKPSIDCVRLRQYQGNDQVQAALIRGEIDWGSNFIPDIEKTYVAKDSENNHFWYPAGSPVSIHLNTTKKPFNDLNFRQAFSVAIDREEIVDLATYGYASVNPHITGIGDFYAAWYNDEVNEKYDWLNEFDPDKAIEILDNAGYKDVDGDGFRENPDGTPIDFGIMVVNGWTDWVQSVQMVTEYLKEVGIQAKTKTVEWGQYVDNWKNQAFDAGILWGFAGIHAYRYYEPLLHSRHKGVGVFYEANHGFNTPEIDALLESFAQTADKEKQNEIVNQLQEVVAKNLMIIPLFSNPVWYQYSTKRFVGWPSEDNPFIQPDFYQPGERVLIINNLSQK
jgi:peptide/nickel transport system substrate-binding protein